MTAQSQLSRQMLGEFPPAVLHELEYSILLTSHNRILSYVEREIPPRPMLTTGGPSIVVWTD